MKIHQCWQLAGHSASQFTLTRLRWEAGGQSASYWHSAPTDTDSPNLMEEAFPATSYCATKATLTALKKKSIDVSLCHVASGLH